VYDRDALAGLRFDAPLKSLKAKLEKGEPVFASLVQKMLLDNKHRISVEMVPDTELEARQVHVQ
jgi:Zn-dependent M16 (insulinase) family peptidase